MPKKVAINGRKLRAMSYEDDREDDDEVEEVSEGKSPIFWTGFILGAISIMVLT